MNHDVHKGREVSHVASRCGPDGDGRWKDSCEDALEDMREDTDYVFARHAGARSTAGTRRRRH
ncbi:MAG: hypothetical protein WBX11_04410 [Thiobacillaceae bacterium]